ncbi:MAG: hypothetical protein IPM38_09845 [Ignavibacteria bacterium]|nr:hypothetical protein [Ignavibacteria bacterium]
MIFKKLVDRLFKKDPLDSFLNELFAGGDGTSFENAVIIKAKTSSEGISNEYMFISMLYGNPDKDWELLKQSLADHQNKSYDVMKIKLKNGEVKEVFFDITNFYGKI